MTEGEDVMLGVRVPPELKRLVDADQRTNQEVVQAALWREFGGERKGALEWRAEEKKQRMEMVQEEIDRRFDELEEIREEYEKLTEAAEEKAEEEQERLDEMAAKVTFEESPLLDSDEPRPVQTPPKILDEWAEEANVTRDELVRRARELADE